HPQGGVSPWRDRAHLRALHLAAVFPPTDPLEKILAAGNLGGDPDDASQTPGDGADLLHRGTVDAGVPLGDGVCAVLSAVCQRREHRTVFAESVSAVCVLRLILSVLHA